MNKPLYNWLDKQEGLKVGSSISNIAKELRRQGFTPQKLTDNKGERFVGWSKEKIRQVK